MLQVRETYVNQTTGNQFGNSDWYEAHTEDKARLFRSLQREFGRCVSKMYVDLKSGSGTVTIGWVFEKKMQYEDARNNKPENFYIREVWVEMTEIADNG